MKVKTRSKDSYFIFIISLLMICFVVIVYQSKVNSKYESIINEKRYEYVEKIRHRNESIVNVLDGCIKSNKVTNEELVMLYKNYNDIATAETELWQEYIEDKTGINILSKLKKEKVHVNSISDLYWNIEELIYTYLKEDLSQNVSGIELSGESLEDFSTLLNLSNDLNEYFIAYYQENYNGLDEDKRAQKMMKNNSWFEILKAIQNISDDYIEYQFTYEIEEIN